MAKQTKYPDIFKKTWWNKLYPYNDETILLNNRNKFIKDFNITGFCSTPYQKIINYYKFGTGRYQLISNSEHYYTKNKEVMILVNNPYYPNIEQINRLKKDGWMSYPNLFSLGETMTFIKKISL